MGFGATRRRSLLVFTNVSKPTHCAFVAASDHCKTEIGVPVAQCAWFTITGSDAKAYNASATPSADGKSLVLTAAGAPAAAAG